MDQPSSQELRLQMVWQTVISIPSGRVATYGDVARAAGLPGLARFVGYALRQLADDTRIPWHRVVNSQGRVALAPDTAGFTEQCARLRDEGIWIESGRINLRQYRHSFGAPAREAPSADDA